MGQSCGLCRSDSCSHELPRLLLAAFLCAALLLTGCLWLRLLSLKNQLAQFDRYVRVDDREGLAFEFLQPVVLAKDVRALLDQDPTARSTNGPLQTWSWTFEKLAGANREPPTFDLTFQTGFTNDKLHRFTVPDRFLAFVPKESIVAMFRSLGHAKVNQRQRSASAEWRADKPEEEFRRLSKAELRELLGAPLAVEESEDGSTLRYEYRLRSPSRSKKPNLVVRARCFFPSGTDQLHRAEIRYGDLRLDVAFGAPK